MKIKDKLLSLAGIVGVIVGYFIGLILISLPLNNFFIPPKNEYLRNIIIYVLLLTFTIFYYFLIIKTFGKKEKPKHGLELENRWLFHFIFSMVLATICISIIWSLVLFFGGFRINLNVLTKETWADIFLLLINMLLVGFQEEILSRGALAYIGKKGGKWFSAIVISIFFSISHLGIHGIEVINIIFLLNLFLYSIAAFQLSWFFGDLWSVAGFHFAWNFVMGGIFGVSISGFEATGLIMSKIETSNYINGGEFGLEGSIICSIVLIALINILIIKNRKHKQKI